MMEMMLQSFSAATNATTVQSNYHFIGTQYDTIYCAYPALSHKKRMSNPNGNAGVTLDTNKRMYYMTLHVTQIKLRVD
jgi:hypothetical protein